MDWSNPNINHCLYSLLAIGTSTSCRFSPISVFYSPSRCVYFSFRYLENDHIEENGLCLIILGYIGKKAAKLMLLSAQRTDERLRLMNELIAGVQIIKMYAWEIPFSQIVEKNRK